ncbi:hypothetical protein GCM10010149_88560 [Nonomuraea roseoviolacea subsp. roseoviolacea]|uniref:hypothetical protein n=1 Tax=Nonomuraea roseoviolacea TaxID=103837 RepID=UPI0031D5277B
MTKKIMEYGDFPTSLPLVSQTDIAMRAGVLRQTVASWVSRFTEESEEPGKPPFPDPVAEVRSGQSLIRVYWWPAVKEWLKKTDRPYNANWTVEEVNRQQRKFDQRSPRRSA